MGSIAVALSCPVYVPPRKDTGRSEFGGEAQVPFPSSGL